MQRRSRTEVAHGIYGTTRSRASEHQEGRDCGVTLMKARPRNEKGQPPTKNADETVDRLEQKKRQDRGGANKERIERQQREVRRG